VTASRHSVQSLLKLPLVEARKHVGQIRKQCIGERGSWNPTPNADVFQRSERRIAVFAGRSDWDEPENFAHLKGRDTLYPRTLPGNEMDFAQASRSNLKKQSSLGTLEPDASLPASEPDAILVPCLFADRQGHRIGRGGGFYDRYLSRCPSVRRIAVLHSDWIFETLPEEWLQSHDVPVDALWTESFYLSLNSRSPQS
jgi:5,10-methenyltetrahydrofolate synthetase